MSWKRQCLTFHFIWNLVLCATSEGLDSPGEGVGDSTEFSFLENRAGPQGKSQLSEQGQYNTLMAEKLEDLGMTYNTPGKHNLFSPLKVASRQRQDTLTNRNQQKTTETKLLGSHELFRVETLSDTDPGSEDNKRGWEGLQFNGKRKRGWEGLNFNGRRGLDGTSLTNKRGWEGLNFNGKRGWEGLNFHGKRGWEGLNFNGRRGSAYFPIKSKRGWEGLNFNGKRGWEGLNFNGKRGWEGLNFNGKRGLDGSPISDKPEGLNFHKTVNDDSRVQVDENSQLDNGSSNSKISDNVRPVIDGKVFGPSLQTLEGAMKESDNTKRGWEGLTMFSTCKCCEKGEFWRCCNSCHQRSRASVQPTYAQKRDLVEDIICACCLRSNVPSCCDVCQSIKGDQTG